MVKWKEMVKAVEMFKAAIGYKNNTIISKWDTLDFRYPQNKMELSRKSVKKMVGTERKIMKSREYKVTQAIQETE